MEAIFQDGYQKHILSPKLFFPADILGYKGHKTIMIFPKYMICGQEFASISVCLMFAKQS